MTSYRPECFTWCTVHTPADDHLSILTLIGALSEEKTERKHKLNLSVNLRAPNS